jgi:hypothetical protein
MVGHRTFVLDTHVHYYSQFSPEGICRCAVTNLEAQAPDSLPGIVLVDTGQWPTYDDLISNLSGMSEFRVQSHRDHAVIIFSEEALVRQLYVFRGAQRVASEGFEMLCLFNTDVSFEPQPAEDLLMEITALGGLPVVPWSYGKWLGAKRTKLREFCKSSRDRGCSLFLGDICQRPAFIDKLKPLAGNWGAAGVLAGSDPLPLEGEEVCIGTLGTVLSVPDNFKSLTIVGELKKAMQAGSITVTGKHDSLIKGLYRRVRYSTTKSG